MKISWHPEGTGRRMPGSCVRRKKRAGITKWARLHPHAQWRSPWRSSPGPWPTRRAWRITRLPANRPARPRMLRGPHRERRRSRARLRPQAPHPARSHDHRTGPSVAHRRREGYNKLLHARIIKIMTLMRESHQNDDILRASVSKMKPFAFPNDNMTKFCVQVVKMKSGKPCSVGQVKQVNKVSVQVK